MPGWQYHSLTVDSGAAETVIPHKLVQDHETQETDASRSGWNYASATVKADFGQFQFWPIHFWPSCLASQLWPIHFWPILFFCVLLWLVLVWESVPFLFVVFACLVVCVLCVVCCVLCVVCCVLCVVCCVLCCCCCVDVVVVVCVCVVGVFRASLPDPLRRTPLRRTAQNFALFFPSPATVFLLFSSLVGPFR